MSPSPVVGLVRRSLSTRTRFLVAPVALLASSAMVWHASSSAFHDETSNGTSSWAAGTVQISDDDAGTAMFNVSGLSAGATGTRCIQVAYTGTLAAEVRLHASGTGALAPYLTLAVERGSGATTGSCAGFVPAGTVFSGTLDDLITNHSDYSAGVDSWSVPTPPASRSYRVTYTLASTAAAQGKAADAVLTWEAQNT
jgi:hypothetical protein